MRLASKLALVLITDFGLGILAIVKIEYNESSASQDITRIVYETK